MNQSNWDGF